MRFAAVFTRPRAGARLPAVLDALAASAAIIAIAVSSVLASTREDGAETRAVGGTAGPLLARNLSLPRETMVGAYAGAPYAYPSDVTIRKPGVHDLTIENVTWDGKPFDEPVYYGARVARWFGGNAFGSMVDFTHSKTIARLAEDKTFTGTLQGAPAPARAALGTLFRKLEFSHGHNLLTLNGLMRLPGLGTAISPYVGLGGGVALPHAEVHLRDTETRTYEYQFAGIAGQALVGVEFRLPRISVFVEYKFSFAPYRVPLSERDSRATAVEDWWNQWRSWLAGEEPPNGTLATTLASHQVISGLGVRFASPTSVAAP